MANWNGEVASREEIRQQKRRAALRIASRLFNEKGYHATSLDEIAEEIGVTKTALYYYFRNKEELLFDCLSLSFECGEEARREAEALSGSAFDKFCHYYKSFIQNSAEQCGAITTLTNIRALPQSMQDDLMQKREKLHDFTREILEEARNEGAVRAVNPETTAHYFLGTMNWMLSWHQENPELEPEELGQTFLDQILHGIAKT